MFGNGGGSGYGRFHHNGGYERVPPNKAPGGLYDIYDWPKSFAPPPPPPALVNCGELRRRDVGKVVELTGRLHKISRERFVQIKDGNGITQLVVPIERTDMQNRFQRMPLQSYVSVLGEVQARPIRGQNEKMATGDIEVVIEEILMVRVSKMDGKTKALLPSSRREPPSDDNPPKITSEEYHKFHGLLPQLNERKYTCGDLVHKVNEHVKLLCWVEKSSKKFVTLMDGYGKIQCVVPSNRDEIVVIADHLTANAVVNVTGKVMERPKSQVNYSTFNGHIELQIESMDWPIFDMENISKGDAEVKVTSEAGPLSQQTVRTHTCGELRAEHVGQGVVLCGWLHSHRLDKFVLISDAYGMTQCVVSQQGCSVDLSGVPLESVLKIEGVVAMRPPNMANDDIKTGDIEVVIKELTVLSAASERPFDTLSREKQEELARLRHRYMDLRTPNMQNNLRLRSKMLHNMRSFLLDKLQFVEVDTPTIGAPFGEVNSLKVQTEEHKTENYLVRCPHLHMQYLMVGQMDRCFQVSKSYMSSRVEGQLETSRLHIVMSFTEQDMFLSLVENLLHVTFPKCIATPPFMRITHADAQYTYGSNHPDLSYDLKLYDVTEGMDKPADLEKFGAFAVIYPRSIGKFSHEMRSLLMTLKIRYDAVQVSANVQRDISALVENKVRKLMKLDQNNSYILAYGDKEQAALSMGEVRQVLAKELSSKQLLHRSKVGVRPAWVTSPPMFPHGAAAAHSFAAVHPDDKQLSDVLEMRAMAFSLVMNGECYAEGWMRNTDPELLRKQLELMKIEPSVADNLLQAVQSGCPPYAMISLDIDKLAAFACEADSVREVVAFPKSETGQDMLALDIGAAQANNLKSKQDDSTEPNAKIPKLFDIRFKI